jgi:hypothetical protein
LITCSRFLSLDREKSPNHLQNEIDVTSLKIKDLRKILEERGVECVGCIEKSHLLEKVKESMHLPKIIKESKPSEPDAKQIDPKEYEEIMKLFKKQDEEKIKNLEKLKQMGFDTSKLKNSNFQFPQGPSSKENNKKTKKQEDNEDEYKQEL